MKETKEETVLQSWLSAMKFVLVVFVVGGVLAAGQWTFNHFAPKQTVIVIHKVEQVKSYKWKV